MQHVHNNLLNLFIAFREFIVYRGSKMHNMDIFDYLGFAEKEIYHTMTTDINYLEENCDELKELTEIFSGIQKNNLCSENTNKGKCDHYTKSHYFYYLKTSIQRGSYKNLFKNCTEILKIIGFY